MCETIESAFITISRLASGTELTYNLHPVLFPDGGLRPGELVEISGESNTGKSLLCLELIARIILPTNCGGLELEVVLIDCENSYSRPVLLQIMEKYILNEAEPSLASALTDPGKMESIKLAALGRFHLIACYSLEQFEFSLLALPALFALQRDITFVLVDSITTFYWSKCTARKLIRQDTYQRGHCKALNRLARKWKKVVLFTKPSHFGTRQGAGHDFETTGPSLDGCTQVSSSFAGNLTPSLSGGMTSSSVESSLIHHRIELSEIDNPSPRGSGTEQDDQRFNAFVTLADRQQYVRFYLIDSYGMSWIEA
uniref:Rad51-like C-terminal domain-containing protein n=1 Tax=Anopheles epiroticus TaxID=199890 RepID=A0A182PHV3_9DIPT